MSTNETSVYLLTEKELDDVRLSHWNHVKDM